MKPRQQHSTQEHSRQEHSRQEQADMNNRQEHSRQEQADRNNRQEQADRNKQTGITDINVKYKMCYKHIQMKNNRHEQRTAERITEMISRYK